VAEEATARVGLVAPDRAAQDLALPVVTAQAAPDRVDLVIMAPVDRVVPVDRVDRVVPECTDRADRADLVIMAQADLVIMAPVDLVIMVGRAVPECTDRADLVITAPAGPVARGTATTTAGTSTELRGATDLRRGVPASRPVLTGAGRFPHQEGVGTTDRSTTTATTRTRAGTRGSTSGASTSSESGSRCKDSPRETPASPIGGAGVARRGRIP
jgi:hypothetical protein